jgi:hypothetical protein
MCTIPLELERRFEQRWAARFSGALQEHREWQRQQLTARGEANEKPVDHRFRLPQNEMEPDLPTSR